MSPERVKTSPPGPGEDLASSCQLLGWSGTENSSHAGVGAVDAEACAGADYAVHVRGPGGWALPARTGGGAAQR